MHLWKAPWHECKQCQMNPRTRDIIETMDAIRVAKVEHVSCTKLGTALSGTVHLTAHHLIFRYDEGSEEEMWVPYPLISLVTRLPQTMQGQSPLTFHCRTFETFSLAFSRENEAIDVFESVKELTVATSVYQLYAFFYSPNPPLSAKDGWSVYSPRDEFGRMGIGSRTKAWRFTNINKDYSFCPTYPARLVVPTKISDTTLQYAAKYRSKCRIPVLTYFHWSNYGSIARSSQPMVGITQNRSIQDEKLIEAIFQSHYSPESRASNIPVYGATSTNLIIDARPTANAMANTAKGAGTENMDHYKDGRKVYLGIDHIHTMRESLAKIVEALREAESLLTSINNDLPGQHLGLSVLDRQALRRSGWLRHISAIIEGTLLIIRNVHVNSSHVLIHCSDGWDRTAQLSSLAQLCLDPYYRTLRGFQVLVEKDWLAFGHKFMDRCGHLSSDKFFVSPVDIANSGGADAAQAFLASVQNRFASQPHIKETSPIFHQFLEAVRQIQRQFPERFEFNQRFLQQLYYHLYSCQFGTFLFNCEQERRVGDGGPPPCERTISVWDYFNSSPEREKNLNPTYDPTLDDPTSRAAKADMGVLFPNPKDVRFWHELYGRADEEMNGRPVTAKVRGADVISLFEGGEGDPVIRSGTPSTTPLPPSPAKSPLPFKSSPSRKLARLPSDISPPLTSSSQDHSTSLLDISTSTPVRADSLKPFASTSSTLSSKPPSPPPPSSNPPPQSPSAYTKPPDYFASSGVKSVWGKLSSNASAALSVVQGAYDGVTKDIKNMVSSDGELSEKTSELRTRDSLTAWDEEQVPSTIRPAGSSFAVGLDNPWATTKSRTAVSPASFENPWGSMRASIPRQDILSLTDEPSNSLPVDPTVAHPILRSPSLHSTTTPPISSTSNEHPSSTPPRSRRDLSPPPAADSTDPLGVGLL